MQENSAGDTFDCMDSSRLSRRDALKATAGAGFFAGGDIRQDTIHVDQERQVIDNFGASDCWSMQRAGGWSTESRERVADLLFSETKGIGLSCWRFNIGAGICDQIRNPWRTAETFETGERKYDWSRQKNERWFLGAAKERGVAQFLAFVNSPPARMTRNGLTFCGPEGTTNLKPGYEARYARYLVDILEHFRTNKDERERIRFQYLSPVNEPQWDWTGNSQEGNRASNADIKRMLRAVHTELDRRECPTEMAALESGSLPDLWKLNEKSSARFGAGYGNYLEEFLGDPEIAPLLDGRLSYHDYGSDPVDGPMLLDRVTLGDRLKRYPGWKFWMSEYCILVGAGKQGGDHRDLTMTTALEVARLMHLDFTVVGVSAWQWWLALSSVDYKDGLLYTDWRRPGDAESILPSRLLWAFGNWSRFVRPGMRRVELSTPHEGMDGPLGSAYKDEKGRRVVVVYVNLSRDEQRVRVAFPEERRSWKLRSLTPYVTSDRAGDELKRYPDVGPDTVVALAPRSVTTLVAQS